MPQSVGCCKRLTRMKARCACACLQYNVHTCRLRGFGTVSKKHCMPL